uniref:Uncharacterized protein n=1 Tax=Hyaloperonospora arabidopsidis (strain Emoy2) TaxID=559515 RepID=M4BMK9_HYAAE
MCDLGRYSSDMCYLIGCGSEQGNDSKRLFVEFGPRAERVYERALSGSRSQARRREKNTWLALAAILNGLWTKCDGISSGCLSLKRIKPLPQFVTSTGLRSRETCRQQTGLHPNGSLSWVLYTIPRRRNYWMSSSMHL